MINPQQQRPYSNKNQVEQTKNNIPRAVNLLTGHFANSMNGGHNKTIYWKQIMAGERHREFNIQLNMQMLTPLTPAYQNLKCTVRTYFVPNSRVWENAEKFTAQGGGEATQKIEEKPNLGGKVIPCTSSGTETPQTFTNISNTTAWRDSFISSYLGRPAYGGTFKPNDDQPEINGIYPLPKIDVLPLRGRVAIYNDYERYKEIEPEAKEYKDDTVSNEEWNSYLPLKSIYESDNPSFNIYGIQENTDYYEMRARKNNSYYNNIRMFAQGFELETPESQEPEKDLINWASWESKIAEARAQAENEQKNPWEIISEIRGSKKLTEGKVQLISEKTFNVNYSAITQNAYNNNQDIKESFQVMGKQGAYSYTETKLTLYSGMEFIEEGYIHVIATVSADTVFEKQFDRTLLNVSWLDNYRPDLKDDKLDSLYLWEVSTTTNDTLYNGLALGFKRKYSELFKMPNIIGGDMTTDNYYKEYEDILDELTNEKFVTIRKNSQIETNSTYQFFESDIFTIPNNLETLGNSDGNTTVGYAKSWWKDYTDFMINKNQAIVNEVKAIGHNSNSAPVNEYESRQIKILGQNQIFFVGIASCIAELPVDKAIADNYTTWGEH